MPTQTRDPIAYLAPQPFNRAAVALMIRWVLAAFLAVGILLSILTLICGTAQWWRGLGFASAIAALTILASLPLLLWGLRATPARTITAVIGASSLRMIATLAACVAAVLLFAAPAAPTLLFSVAFYFAILISETYGALHAFHAAGAPPAGASA